MIDVLVIPEWTSRRTLMPCASIRLFLPLTKEIVTGVMSVRFAPIENIDSQRAKVIIAHRISLTSADDVTTVGRYCRSNNAKFVYDLDDDLLALASDHTQSNVYEGLKPVIRRALTSADQIWTSTEVLAERCRKYGSDVVTIPNSLDRRIWSPPVGSAVGSQVTSFLYMGTPTHRTDLASVVLPAFSRLKREAGDKVSLTVVGVADRPDSTAPYSTLNPPPNIALSYPAFANWLQCQGPFDVGLAPLRDTTFNRGKSNIKQLEYAALGLPTIASDLPPYRRTPYAQRGVVLVEPTAEGFYCAMRDMAYGRSKREKLRLAAQQLAGELLGAAAEQEPRIQIIEKLIKNADPPRASFMGELAAKGDKQGEPSEEYMPAAVDPGPIPHTEHCIAFYFFKAPYNFSSGTKPAAHVAERCLAKRFGLTGFCYHFDDLAEGFMLDELLGVARETDDDFLFCLSLDGGLVSSKPVRLMEWIAPLLQSRNYIRVGGRPILVIRHVAPLGDATLHHLRAQWRIASADESDLLIVGMLDAQAGPRVPGVDAILEVAEAPRKDADLVRRSIDSEPRRSPAFRIVPLKRDGLRPMTTGAAKILHSSPAAYQEWLENACRFARENSVANAAIVFIDGWNDGQHENRLQPTPRFGYAYLNATAKALQSVDPANSAHQLALGVVAHVFYEDLWHEIAVRLRRWHVPFRLYVTVPEGKEETTSALIQPEWPTAIVTGVANRGRDIAPFLEQARLAEEDGVDVICKVHTKKSPHRADGDEWRRDLYDKLLGDANCPIAVASAFAANAALGIIAPKGHLIAGEYFWGANRARVQELAVRLGYVGPLEPFTFSAGSMFWVRSRALKPMFDLGFKSVDFEPETGQVDGTLAHALERLFPFAAKRGGYRLADTRVLGADPRAPDHLRSEAELAYLNEPRSTYRFAPAGHPAQAYDCPPTAV